MVLQTTKRRFVLILTAVIVILAVAMYYEVFPVSIAKLADGTLVVTEKLSFLWKQPGIGDVVIFTANPVIKGGQLNESVGIIRALIPFSESDPELSYRYGISTENEYDDSFLKSDIDWRVVYMLQRRNFIDAPSSTLTSSLTPTPMPASVSMLDRAPLFRYSIIIDEATGKKRYEDLDNHFTFLFPSDFVVKRTSENSITLGKGEPLEYGWQRIGISVEKMSLPQNSRQVVLEEFKDDLPEWNNVTNVRPADLPGIDATRLDRVMYGMGAGGPKLYIVEDRLRIIIVTDTINENYDMEEPIRLMDDVAVSFRFTN